MRPPEDPRCSKRRSGAWWRLRRCSSARSRHRPAVDAPRDRPVAGFGAGALIAAVTLDLTASPSRRPACAPSWPAWARGAITFSAGNWALHRGGAVRHRKRSAGQQEGADPLGILLGTILDGDPGVGGHRDLAARGRRRSASRSWRPSRSPTCPRPISATTGLRPGRLDDGRIIGPVGSRRRPERGRGRRGLRRARYWRADRRRGRRSRRSPRARCSRCWPTR